MGKTRPILYGVADYAELRRANGWFIDRTAKIRDLEATHFAMFLRPRRFGKSLFLSILEAYYDIERRGRFDELFAGTDIGASPTDERGKYMILYFNFSAVNKDVRKVEDSFEKYAAERFSAFAENYAEASVPESRRDFVHKMNVALKELVETRMWLRIIVLRKYVSEKQLVPLINETDELAKIFHASVMTARRNLSQEERR